MIKEGVGLIRVGVFDVKFVVHVSRGKIGLMSLLDTNDGDGRGT